MNTKMQLCVQNFQPTNSLYVKLIKVVQLINVLK